MSCSQRCAGEPPRSAWWLVLWALLSLTACRSGAEPPPPPSSDAVGRISDTTFPESYLDGERTEIGAGIPRDAELTTDESGIVQFSVPTFDTECRLHRDALLRTTDGDWPLLRLRTGQLVCGTTPARREAFIEVRGRLLRVMDSATFNMAVNERGGGVGVLSGAVEAHDPEGGGSDVVEAGETLGWHHDGRLNPAWNLPPVPEGDPLPGMSAPPTDGIDP